MWAIVVLNALALGAAIGHPQHTKHNEETYHVYHAYRYDHNPTHDEYSFDSHPSYFDSESHESSEVDYGSHCFTNDDKHGICLPFSLCEGADKAAHLGVHHNFCYKSSHEPVICCPYYPTELPTTEVSLETSTKKPGKPNVEDSSEPPDSIIIPRFGDTTTEDSDRAGNGTETVSGTSENPNIQTRGSEVNESTGISQQKCEEYITAAPQPPTYLAIVGGTPARPGEITHMAALGYGDENNKQWLCGGSLISESYILTASHCLEAQGVGPVQYVRLGDLDLRSDNDSARPQDFRVAERIRHPNYTIAARYNDIALLRLDKPAVFDEYVYPSCLPPPELNPLDQNPVATGWGRVEFEGDPSNILLKVTLEWFGDDECQRFYGAGTRRLLQGVNLETQVCAGSRTEEKDTCSGDSGGPLNVGRSGLVYNIVGVTSFGKICGQPGLPAVYTKVQPYVPWIESIVWPEQ